VRSLQTVGTDFLINNNQVNKRSFKMKTTLADKANEIDNYLSNSPSSIVEGTVESSIMFETFDDDSVLVGCKDGFLTYDTSEEFVVDFPQCEKYWW
jgi:hypothetical protein